MQNHDYLLANAVYEREERVWDFTYDPGQFDLYKRLDKRKISVFRRLFRY